MTTSVPCLGVGTMRGSALQIQQRVLRLAAAASVTVFLVAGAVGPAQATDSNTSDGTSATETRHSDNTKSQRGKSDHSDGNASTRGDSTEPQPESTADQNDGGANSGTCEESTDSTETTSSDSSESSDSTSADSTDSPDSADSTDSTETNNYCSTRDGSASQNGEGDGNATGKPCAGCVGKADNKNPPGQYPDGSDANNGYECDGNNGIGKSNPAHTGCTSSDVVAGTDTESCPVDDDGMVKAASAEDAAEVCPAGGTTPGSSDEVLGVEAEAGANRPAAQVEPASAGLLPETGAGRYGIPIVAGLALLGAGAAMLVRKRPQTGR